MHLLLHGGNWRLRTHIWWFSVQGTVRECGPFESTLRTGDVTMRFDTEMFVDRPILVL